MITHLNDQKPRKCSIPN